MARPNEDATDGDGPISEMQLYLALYHVRTGSLRLRELTVGVRAVRRVSMRRGYSHQAGGSESCSTC